MHTKTLNISYLDKLLRSPLLRSDFSLVRLIFEITTFLLFSRSTPKSPKIPQNSQTLKFLKILGFDMATSKDIVTLPYD